MHRSSSLVIDLPFAGLVAPNNSDRRRWEVQINDLRLFRIFGRPIPGTLKVLRQKFFQLRTAVETNCERILPCGIARVLRGDLMGIVVVPRGNLFCYYRANGIFVAADRLRVRADEQ